MNKVDEDKSIIDEPYSVVDGNHCIVNGRLCTVNGNHCTVNGELCIVNGNHCTIRAPNCVVFGYKCIFPDGNVSCSVEQYAINCKNLRQQFRDEMQRNFDETQRQIQHSLEETQHRLASTFAKLPGSGDMKVQRGGFFIQRIRIPDGVGYKYLSGQLSADHEEVKRLADEEKKHRPKGILSAIVDIPTDNEDKRCAICTVNERIIVLNCGHRQTCASCTLILVRQRKPCPICRQPIKTVIRTFD